MKTPAQIEKELKMAAHLLRQNMSKTGEVYAEHIAGARRIYADLRKVEGFKTPAPLFSADISKLNKDATTILGLALLPAEHSGIANLCAFSDSCADTCVAFSGNGSFPTVYKSRLARTRLMVEEPYSFMVLLVSELFDALNKNETLAVRLNTYSDIRWERVAPWLFEMFRRVQFYDYTKHTTRSRPESTRPANYHLTYSVSEKTTRGEISKAADIGRPLAVVVAIRSGKVPALGAMRPIAPTWAGMPTVDGDASDARWTTPTGHVVILRRKHTMDPFHPMITKAQQLRDGAQQ